MEFSFKIHSSSWKSALD